MTYFIDANVFLRVLVGDNKQQFIDCVKLIKAIKENKIEANTSTLVLAEVAWTLGSYYEFKKEKVVRGIRSIVNLRGIKIVDDYNNLLALEHYEKYSVKYIDTLIASNQDIQSKQNTIVSYDRDFDSLSVIRKEPREVLEELSSLSFLPKP